ncbi:MAG: peptide deformylase [candidate division WOR-3 bacterium]|nr:peptide deformylase [candidate division WOR-3 bacterium]
MNTKECRIVLYGNSILRTKTAEVKEITDDVRKVIEDLKRTLILKNGLGLAANQIGSSLRIFCYNSEYFNLGPGPVVIINPEIVHKEGTYESEEACLSLPGITEVVARAQKVTVRGLSENGQELIVSGSDLLARVFQHEIDHLNGILFIDYLSPLRKKMLKKELDEIIKLAQKQCE